jgi:hypothetical protein
VKLEYGSFRVAKVDDGKVRSNITALRNIYMHYFVELATQDVYIKDDLIPKKG